MNCCHAPLRFRPNSNHLLCTVLESCLKHWPEGVARIGGAAQPGSLLEHRHIRVLLRNVSKNKEEANEKLWQKRKDADKLSQDVQAQASKLADARRFTVAAIVGHKSLFRSLLMEQVGSVTDKEKAEYEEHLTNGTQPDNAKHILAMWLPPAGICKDMSASELSSPPTPGSGSAGEEREEQKEKARERNQFRSLEESAVKFNSSQDKRPVFELKFPLQDDEDGAGVAADGQRVVAERAQKGSTHARARSTPVPRGRAGL